MWSHIHCKPVGKLVIKDNVSNSHRIKVIDYDYTISECAYGIQLQCCAI